MAERNREYALLRAVELYYFDGLTQAAISERLGCTRWTVGRLLKEAADQGIVEVKVHHDEARQNNLEMQLVAAFHLQYCRVIPAQPTLLETVALLARTAADFISDLRPRPAVVALGFGRTIGAVARALPENWGSGATVVQMSAAPASLDPSMVTGTIKTAARRAPGKARILPGAAIHSTQAELHQVLTAPQVRETLAAARGADVHAYSPGIVDRQANLLRGDGLTQAEKQNLLGNGKAIIGNRVIDGSGTVVAQDVDARTLGVDLDDLRSARLSVAVGTGTQKWPAFAALLEGRLANCLVIDARMGEHLLSHHS